MIKRTIAAFLFVVFVMSPLGAQQSGNFTISGYVQDQESGERLIGANVFDPDQQLGTTTNTYGFFSLTLPAGSLRLTVAYVGYRSSISELSLDRDLQLTISLQPAAVAGDTIEVVGEIIEQIEERSQMSVIDLPVLQIRSLPSLLGEVDVLKTLQLLPGVLSGNEGTSGLYIRGGGPDQNLILLDDAPVYNASHLFGFFSVFNADATKTVRLTKGGFPARFGGRLSSVLEINLKEGNNQEFKGHGAVGLIASRLTLEGPLGSDKTAFIISGRRTYADIIARPFMGEDIIGYYFYDLNAKINHTFSPKNRLYLSIYNGDDKFNFENRDSFGPGEERKESGGINWGNITSTLRWNHLFSNKLFANTTLIFSRYRFEVEIENEENDFREQARYFSGIRDISGKIDFDYIPNPRHHIRYGISAVHHTFEPGAFQVVAEEGSDLTLLDSVLTPSAQIEASEFSAYLEDDWDITSRLKANIGIHSSLFQVGSASYQSIQPRLSARFLVGDWAFKGAFATMRQNIHLLTNAGLGMPTDLWVPATPRVLPQESVQYGLGIARSLADKKFEFSVEGYYKTMDNLIEYREGAAFLDLEEDWQDKVTSGSGESYGLEVFLQKKHGRTTGWLGYSLAETNRKFPDVNFGEEFPYRYDRRHDVKIAVSHQLQDHLEISSTWVYGTGNAITLARATFTDTEPTINNINIFSGTTEYYDGRNSFRAPAYHRLDIALRYHRVVDGERSGTLSLSIYNAYNRYNPYFLYFGENDDNEPALRQVSLFPIIPSLSYSFHF